MPLEIFHSARYIRYDIIFNLRPQVEVHRWRLQNIWNELFCLFQVMCRDLSGDGL